MLRDAGYATALIGKSGVACNSNDAQLLHDKGFEHFFGYTSHSFAHHHYPPWLWRNGERVLYPGNEGRTGVTYDNLVITDEALAWIAEQATGDNAEQPFFLHLAYTGPHADYTVPEEYMAPFIGRFEEVPFAGGHYTAQATPAAAYAGMMTFLDEQIGRVLDQLQQSGLDENTIVFFATDNGPPREGGYHYDMLDSNGIYRGGKRDLYEGGIRTPVIVRWPGTIEAGGVTDHQTAFWDFMPTACELAGIETPEWTDGLSLVPVLTGVGEPAVHEYLYWEFYEGGGKQAVRFGDYKGIRLGVGQDRNAPIELYDLAVDPGETNNIAAEHPDVVARIAEIMVEAHTPSDRFTFEDGFIPQVNPNAMLPFARTLDKTAWRVIDVSSESTDNGRVATNAIDGNLTNWWHTQWVGGAPGYPHHLTLDLGAEQTIAGLRYLPRQDGNPNGRVADYVLYAGDDPRTQETLVAQGRFADAARQQEVRFAGPIRARYLRLVLLNNHQQDNYAAIGELDLLAE